MKVHGNFHVPLHVWCMNAHGKGTWKFPCTFTRVVHECTWKGAWKFACTLTRVVHDRTWKFPCTLTRVVHEGT